MRLDLGNHISIKFPQGPSASSLISEVDYALSRRLNECHIEISDSLRSFSVNPSLARAEFERARVAQLGVMIHCT